MTVDLHDAIGHGLAVSPVPDTIDHATRKRLL